MAKLTVWHNLVYSTKGGCGKTTLCLNFPKMIVREEPELSDYSFKPDSSTIEDGFEGYIDHGYLRVFKDEQNQNCNKIDPYTVIIDLDLAASNIVEMEGADLLDNKTGLFLCDYIIDKKPFDYVDLTHAYEVDNGKILLIKGPRDENERNYFKTKRRYIPTVRFEEYKYSILALINGIIGKICAVNLNNITEDSASILNLVYDLPPNSDGYTEVLFDALLNNKSVSDKNGLIDKLSGSNQIPKQDCHIEHKFRLIMPTNPEKSIKYINHSWLESFIASSGSNRKINQIFLLENDALIHGIGVRCSAPLNLSGNITWGGVLFNRYEGYTFYENPPVTSTENHVYFGKFEKIKTETKPTITLYKIRKTNYIENE